MSASAWRSSRTTASLRFGITGDYDTAPDIGVLADGIDAAVATLLRLAGAGPADAAIDQSACLVASNK